MLKLLTDADLIEILQVNNRIHRRLLLDEIQKLSEKEVGELRIMKVALEKEDSKKLDSKILSDDKRNL